MIGIPSLATALVELFKILAHKKLVKGGTFTIRKLEGRNQTSFIQLHKRDTVEIRRVENISGYRQQSCYLKPTVKNFVTIDGIMPPTSGFQMTVLFTLLKLKG